MFSIVALESQLCQSSTSSSNEFLGASDPAEYPGNKLDPLFSTSEHISECCCHGCYEQGWMTIMGLLSVDSNLSCLVWYGGVMFKDIAG